MLLIVILAAALDDGPPRAPPGRPAVTGPIAGRSWRLPLGSGRAGAVTAERRATDGLVAAVAIGPPG